MEISKFKFLDILKNTNLFYKSIGEITSEKSDTDWKNVLILTNNDKEAHEIAEQINFFIQGNELDVLYFPSLDINIYDRVSASREILSKRAYILSKLAHKNYNKNTILVTSSTNLLNKLPNITTFEDSYKFIKSGTKITSKDLSNFLVKNGYTASSVAYDSGEFSRRGDILDVVLFKSGYRINFAWDNIESIKEFDPETQLSSNKVEFLELYSNSELTLSEQNVATYKSNFLKSFGVTKANNQFFEKPNEGIKFQGIEALAGAFYKDASNILEYLSINSNDTIENKLNNTDKNSQTALPIIFSTNHSKNAVFIEEKKIFKIYESKQNYTKSKDNFYPAFPPEILFYNKDYIEQKLKNSINIYAFNQEGFNITPNFYAEYNFKESQSTSLTNFLDYSKENYTKKIIISCTTNSSFERIKKLLEFETITTCFIKNISEAKKFKINLTFAYFEFGFSSKDYIIIPCENIIGKTKHIQKSSRKRLKNIFKELENFNEGDLVVHKDHGIGRYEGIIQLDVNSYKHDCLLLIYAKGDKLYIPAENIHLIKKYGSGDVELDHLGSVAWQKRKAKLKEKIGQLALKIINLAAKRQLNSIDPLDIPKDEYEKFCQKFPYSETEDQLQAAEDIYNDLLSGKAMERLICGDVGFGKTEIAMRAAFLVCKDRNTKNQVAIIVPTTILARQHYENFLERFDGTGIKIRQLSRFVDRKDAKLIKTEISNGEIDIIIGTHALLSKDVNFKNLALLITDEEQHFGVVQKERLKQVSENIHSLTLTATPIPRTLQMSMIGIRDLSLIATPPVDRLSVKTNLTEFDEVIIREALLKEKHRGGKSFFVVPKIKDIEEIADYLKSILPELKINIAHGRMTPSSIDDVMTEFYEGNFDVLFSTAIVESGLDIPMANTMIIYKAENFGLSQLYQLRGRVGRSKERGYCYLINNKNKAPTKSAIKRIELLQSIDSLGAGFRIASSDMDNRGFGNLVGDEQSGHIKEVGSELYQEMLEEEISNIKDSNNNQKSNNQLPEINLKAEIYIPNDYIKDQHTRLAIYRKAGEINNIDEVYEFENELIDRFGKIPQPVLNFIDIIKLRVECINLHIKQIDMGPGGFNIKFLDSVASDNIFKFVQNNPSSTKLKPDNKLVYKKDLKESNLIKEAQILVRNLNEYL